MIDTPENATDAPTEPEKARNARRLWWIIGGSFTGAMLIFALTLGGVWIWTASSPLEHGSHSEEYTEALAGVDVDVEIGSIHLAAADGDALEVVRETSWRGTEPTSTETWRGETFIATGECDDSILFWVNIDECEVHYTMHLPTGADAEATIDVGDISLDGLDGDIDVETSVGDVTGQRLNAASTRVESSVGSISLAFDKVNGDINVTTSTGDVELVLPDDGTTYDVRFASGVGDQDIDIATDPAAEADVVINVNTSVGDLTVRYAD
ncbi:DUF4097 family beta strand repeat-containing protein [Glycomyces paridis]|uniref:DUF4097 domain-containing protein n=1 Tax=Glycomyces paridis TaxID=2126555 RepID=A0A4S8PHX0_9ACTN|nr:DUF4097 family beta strand repeat-containing protein [Glycomyces paridis]THV30197.1 DUF4097 domain-containing protein [Glycomyces paridis]